MAPYGCLVPRSRARAPTAHSPGRGGEAAKTLPAASHTPEPRTLQITPDHSPSPESRPKDLLFPEIFRFPGHSPALPGMQYVPGLNKMLWCSNILLVVVGTEMGCVGGRGEVQRNKNIVFPSFSAP